jgi:hypothetical protein
MASETLTIPTVADFLESVSSGTVYRIVLTKPLTPGCDVIVEFKKGKGVKYYNDTSKYFWISKTVVKRDMKKIYRILLKTSPAIFTYCNSVLGDENGHFNFMPVDAFNSYDCITFTWFMFTDVEYTVWKDGSRKGTISWFIEDNQVRYGLITGVERIYGKYAY